MTDYKMTEDHLRGEIYEFLSEQDYYFSGKPIPTKILCLIAAIKNKALGQMEIF